MSLPVNKTNMPQSDILSWDSHYDNPRSEIILVSSDKIGFRVDAWQLSKQRDLLDFPSSQPLELAPIELDQNSDVLQFFIDCFMLHDGHSLVIDLHCFGGLLKLCDRFQSEGLKILLRNSVKTQLQRRPIPSDCDPWAIFKIAAHQDDLDLARSCILALGAQNWPHAKIYQTCPSRFDSLPQRYAVGLLLAGYSYESGFYVTGTPRKRTWPEVAKAFRVV